MAIEYRLGRSDHRVVERFLDWDASGVDAIAVDAPNVRTQSGAIEMAKKHDVGVFIEPLTERLVEPGFDPKGLDYANSYPLDLGRLTSLKHQAELVERVVGTQIEVATQLTPPHFYVEDDDVAGLNVTLAGLTLQAFRSSGLAVRPILTVSRAYLSKDDRAKRLAAEYRNAGVRAIELRLSPMGGEDEGPLKIASAFEIARHFKDAGLDVVFGLQPSIGHTAYALGIAAGYSTGIGAREHVNHPAAMNQQRKPPSADKGRFGVAAGVFLPGAGITVPRRLAQSLYGEKSVRTKLKCELGACADEIGKPAMDPRPHYLHARAALVQELEEYPAQWRPTHENTRLGRALELRWLINQRYLPELRRSHPVTDLGTRTCESLASIVQRNIEAAQSA